MGAVGLVAASYLAVRLGRAELVDGPVRRSFEVRHDPVTDLVVGASTDLGSVYALGGIGTVLAATGRRAPAFDVALAGGIAWTAAQAAKPLLARRRPYDLGDTKRLVAEPAGTSWPSGHAALATAVAESLAPSLGRRGRAGVRAAAVAVGLSRCYVGVHHLTDVVAGVGLGALSGRLATVIGRRLRTR